MFARCLPVLLGILIAVRASGEPAPPPPAPAPDFAAGFSKLAALGLPALDANARWSTLPDTAGGDDYQLRNLFKSLKGNGWSLPAADGKTSALPAGAVAAAGPDALSNNDAMPPPGLLGRVLGGDSAKPAKPAPAADLAKDVRALIAALAKAGNDDEQDPFSGSSAANIPANVAGRMLMIATQIYQHGDVPLANQLAAAVFETTASREAAVDFAVSMIADHAYESAALAFFTSGDWAAYHRTLTELIAKFPRGWSAREAVAMLIPQVAKQAAGEPPAVPSLPAIPLDPAALDAIQQLTAKPAAGNSAEDDEKMAKLAGVDLSSMTPRMRAQVLASLRRQMRGYHYGSSSSWLLDPPDAKPKTNSPLAKLTALGVAALPALAALADDPYLTLLPNEKANDGSSSYYSSDEGDAERIQRIHTRLNRPSSRGEIACNLLRAALPNPSNDLYQATPESLRDLALAFWKENRQASCEDLAAVFLRDGSSYQIQTAATRLASSADPKARQTFESHVLAADPAIAQFRNVQTYLTVRKAAAKPFFDAYAKLVRSQSSGTSADDDNPSNEYSYAIKQAGGPEKILNQLEKFVTGASPRAVAREIAKGKPKEAPAAIGSLIDMMKDDTPVKRLYALLEGAVAAEDPAIRCHFLQATYRVGWKEFDPMTTRTEPGPDRTLPEAEIKVWQQLVADTRDVPNPRGGKAILTIGDFAAEMLELSINPGHFQATQNAAPILRKTVTQLYREQAAAHLAGQPVPPLPDASQVKPDRIRAIISEAGTKPAAGIHPYLDTLTPDERAAWLEWIRKPGDIAIPQSVKDLFFLVIGREDRGNYDFPDVKGAGLIDTGFVANPTNLRSYVESLAKDVAKHSRTGIYLNPAEFGPGLEVIAQVYPLPQKAPENASDDNDDPFGNRYQPNARSVFSACVEVLDQRESAEGTIRISLPNMTGEDRSANWLFEKGKAEPLDADQLTAFDAALQAAAESPESPESRQFDIQIQIQILSKTDADKITESSRD